MPKKILIVDDERDFLGSIAEYLRSKGYAVDTALEGEQALQKLRAGPPPDLAVIDIVMPNMDGHRLGMQMKQDPKYQRIPLIILSATVAEEGKPEPWEIGHLYVSKPVDPDALLRKIQGLIGAP